MKPIEQDQNYNGEIQLHTNSEKKDFQQQCVANEKMMVKMKKCFNDDDNGYDDNGADVKVKRAFKKSDCAGTQGAAAPSPSAQLSRIQPLQLPLLQPLNFHYYKHFYFHYLNHYNFHYKEYNINYYN